MAKPVILVVSLCDYDKKSLWMLPGYLEGVKNAGGVPFMIPLYADENTVSQLFSMCDGVLFTGGQDVNPEIYHETPSPELGEICKERDAVEKMLLEKCITFNKPFLGICRGIQFVNAVLGGTLYQDLPTEIISSVNHRMEAPYNRKAHNVNIVPDSPLYSLLGEKTIPVNSCHHQAIKVLSPRLSAMAMADDGITEAVFMPEVSFGWGIQWHPEMWYEENETSKKIFQSFTDAAEKYRTSL